MLKGLWLLLACIPLHLFAGVIYSNVGPAFPNDLSIASNYSASATGFFGTTFNTSSSGRLASIVTDLFQFPGATALSTGLYADSSGQPGPLLESWNVPVPISDGSSITPVTTFSSLLNPILSSGARYWFVVNLGTTPNNLGW